MIKDIALRKLANARLNKRASTMKGVIIGGLLGSVPGAIIGGIIGSKMAKQDEINK